MFNSHRMDDTYWLVGAFSAACVNICVSAVSGFRKYSDIAVWDLRNSGELLYTLNRSAPTNQVKVDRFLRQLLRDIFGVQRIHFDISADSQMVFTGSEDRSLKAYSLLDGSLVWQLEQLEGQFSLLLVARIGSL